MKQLFGWIGIAAIILTACQNEMIQPVERTGVKDLGDSIEMELSSFAPLMSHPESKALNSIQESRIYNMTILVFNSSDQYLYQVKPIKIYVDNSFVVRLKKSTGEVRLVFLTNLDAMAQSTVAAISSGSKGALLGTIKINTSSKYTAAMLPMWGESYSITVDGSLQPSTIGTGAGGAIVLHRSLARVNVMNHALSEFVMQTVSVYRSKNQAAIAPTSLGAITIPPATINNGALTYNLTASEQAEQKLFNTIYLAEALSSTNIAVASCLVVGGTYKGALCYYRIDFRDLSFNPHPLERNYTYDVYIRQVLGKGYPTEAEALNAGPSNSAYAVTITNDAILDIIAHQSNYIGISAIDTLFISKIGGTQSVTILSSANFSIAEAGDTFNFSLSQSTGNANTPTTITITSSNSSRWEGFLASYTISAGGLIKRFVVKKESDDISYAFAAGNIVYNSTTGQLEISPYPNREGLRFKWGSLIGISPGTSGAFAAAANLFIPSGCSYSSSNSNWTNVPYRQEDMGVFNSKRDEFLAAYPAAGYDIAAGKGDICRYISDMGWTGGVRYRMPTAYEYTLLVERNPGYYKIGSFSSPAGDINGQAQFSGGVVFGIKKNDCTTIKIAQAQSSPAGWVYFPAAGYRLPSGSVASRGIVGSYWSSSPFSNPFGAHLDFDDISSTAQYSSSRLGGYSIRCMLDY